MESLPLLPGYGFTGEDPSLRDFHVKQRLTFLNGFPFCHDDFCPGDSSCKCVPEPTFDPELTYGHKKRTNHHHPRFVPHHVIYHHKVLCFEAYFKIGIMGSAEEHYRIRRVYINYYLEDDTMGIMEPKIPNCGFQQGKLVKRHKIPKPGNSCEYYTWRDLNVGIDIEIYGTVYRTTSCDAFTKEYMNSQGIDINHPECVPADPYIVNREIKKRNELPMTTTPDIASDVRYKFLEYDRMVLYFRAMYNDNRSYQIYFYLADNTIAIYEKLPRIEGGKSRRVLRKTKIPKNWSEVPPFYPAIYQEKTDEEVKEYYAPKDFVIGETVFLFGRKFFLYDCDPFTRTYFGQCLGIEQPPPVYIEPDEDCPPMPPPICPEYPDEHTTDLIRKLYNWPRRLRYNLVMDTMHPEDRDRRFVLEYGLHDGSIRILEPEAENTGRRGGAFLGWIRVPKPGTKEYYTPEDFYIGTKLEIFGRYFLVVGTELYVYKYMLENPDKFPPDLKENIRQYLMKQGLLKQDIECFTNKQINDEGKRDMDIKKSSPTPTDNSQKCNQCESEEIKKLDEPVSDKELPNKKCMGAVCENCVGPECDCVEPECEETKETSSDDFEEKKIPEEFNKIKSDDNLPSNYDCWNEKSKEPEGSSCDKDVHDKFDCCDDQVEGKKSNEASDKQSNCDCLEGEKEKISVCEE